MKDTESRSRATALGKKADDSEGRLAMFSRSHLLGSLCPT